MFEQINQNNIRTKQQQQQQKSDLLTERYWIKSALIYDLTHILYTYTKIQTSNRLTNRYYRCRCRFRRRRLRPHHRRPRFLDCSSS